MRIYFEALRLYDTSLSNKDVGRCLFWCIEVEEKIAALLPTNCLAPHCQGIYLLVKQGQKLNDHGCILSDKSSYFSRPGNSQPGKHFHVSCEGTVEKRPRLVGAWMEDEHQKMFYETVSATWEKYMLQKYQVFQLQADEMNQDKIAVMHKK